MSDDRWIWAELLLGQADLLDRLVDLVDREERPDLLARALSHRAMARNLTDTDAQSGVVRRYLDGADARRAGTPNE